MSILEKLTRRLGDENGSLLIVTLLVLLIIAGMGVALVTTAGSDLDIAGNVRAGEQTLNYADAGLQEALMTFDSTVNTVSVPNALGGGAGAMVQLIPATAGTYKPVVDANGTALPNTGYSVSAQMDADNSNYTVSCNIPGFTVDYGQRRYHVISTGIGPGGTVRQVEAILLSAPQPGLCPPGMGELHP